MEFKYSFVDNLRVVKRTLTTVIAGITLTIAANASPVNLDSQTMSCPDPLEQVIEEAANIKVSPAIDYAKLLRMVNLELSLSRNGGTEMDSDASMIWHRLVTEASDLPFNNVFAQFGSESESFFLSLSFASGHRIDATTYIDEEDDYVYFSVFHDDKIILQNSMPEELFYAKAKKIWASDANEIS
ncbi:MAG: hypothetical protein NC453_31110 [Muribaculum sp.]|nr:hypothetical protein [Muribaculum sp.]